MISCDRANTAKCQLQVMNIRNVHCTVLSTFLYVGKYKNVKGNFYRTPKKKKKVI